MLITPKTNCQYPSLLSFFHSVAPWCDPTLPFVRIREIRVHKSIPWILRETSKFILRILCGGKGPFGRTMARPYVSIRAISVTKVRPYSLLEDSWIFWAIE